jgi:hypothetical protein
MLTTNDIIDIAKVSQYLVNLDIIKGGLYGNGIDLNLPQKIYSVRKNVEWLFDLDYDQQDLTIIPTQNYLLALCGKYAFQAQVIINGGSGTTPIIPINPPSGYSWARITTQVDGQSGSPIAGEYTYQNDELINALYVTIINVNKNTETIDDGDFSFNSGTGTIQRQNIWSANDILIMDFVKVIV